MIKEVCLEIFTVLSTVTQLERVYAAGKTGADGIPDAIGDQVPAAMVYPGNSDSYEQGPGDGERHSYNIMMQVFVSGADEASKVNTALEVFDAIKVAFQSATALNGLGNGNMTARIASWRFGALTYNGDTFTGWDITLFVSEDAPVNYSR